MNVRITPVDDSFVFLITYFVFVPVLNTQTLSETSEKKLMGLDGTITVPLPPPHKVATALSYVREEFCIIINPEL